MNVRTMFQYFSGMVIIMFIDTLLARYLHQRRHGERRIGFRYPSGSIARVASAHGRKSRGDGGHVPPLFGVGDSLVFCPPTLCTK